MALDVGECYEGLMRDVADENGDRFEYAGAESMDVSDDGLVYTFHLRKDANGPTDSRLTQQIMSTAGNVC